MGIKSRIILAAEVAVRQFAKTPFPHQNSAPNFDAVVIGTRRGYCEERLILLFRNYVL